MGIIFFMMQKVSILLDIRRRNFLCVVGHFDTCYGMTTVCAFGRR